MKFLDIDRLDLPFGVRAMISYGGIYNDKWHPFYIQHCFSEMLDKSTRGIIDGLPWAHWKGKAHSDRSETSCLHFW